MGSQSLQWRLLDPAPRKRQLPAVLSFYPDFIVWKDDLIYALDPKGAHLISTDAGLKLMSIRDERGKERVIVRLITEGTWKHDPIRQTGKQGYAVWRMNAAGKPRCTNHDSVEAAVKKALRRG